MSEMFDASGHEFVHLEHVTFTPELLHQIPAHLAHKHQVLPIGIYPHGLSIVISVPCKLDSLDSLCTELSRELEIRIADAQQLRTYISKLYPLAP